MGILDVINFNIPPSPTTSIDFRLLDAPCDQLIRNELVTNIVISGLNSNFSISGLTTGVPYSGVSAIYNAFTYSQAIDPNSSVYIKTQYPYIQDGSFTMLQQINSTVPVVETITVQNTTSTINLQFPPMTNTVQAQQKVFLNATDYNLISFNNYTLSQLYGQIQFNNILDVGSQIVFTYYPDKKKILPNNPQQLPNYQYLGLDINGLGIFQVFGRALASTTANLLLRYTTTLEACPKCGGTGFLNDIVFDGHGRIQLIYDFSKLIQDFFKRLLTQQGSNTLNLTDGSQMYLISGMAKRNPQLLESLIKQEILNILSTIRTKQANQNNLQGISLAEQIFQINSVTVTSPNATDIQIQISITSMGGNVQQIQAQISYGN